MPPRRSSATRRCGVYDEDTALATSLIKAKVSEEIFGLVEAVLDVYFQYCLNPKRSQRRNVELVPGVELIETSGHVPGHQVVLVRLPQTGPVLLTIDAAAMEAELDPLTRLENNGADLDPARARESARRLFELVKREAVTLTVFGHDENLWPTLKKAPEFYN